MDFLAIIGLFCGVLALSLSLSLTIQFARLINHLKEKGIISDNYTIPYQYKKLDKWFKKNALTLALLLKFASNGHQS